MWLWAGFLIAAAASAPAVFAPSGFGRLLQPLTVFHPEWVGERINTITAVLARFREQPQVLAECFGGAVFVQATIVVFYFTVAYALHLNVSMLDLAVVVPMSAVVQLLPVSVNGFGVREATFTFYFARIGHPIESALLVSPRRAGAGDAVLSARRGRLRVAEVRLKPDATEAWLRHTCVSLAYVASGFSRTSPDFSARRTP